MSSIYLERFQLQRPPFSIVPDPEFFYDGGQRGAVLQGLLRALEDDEGICLVVGEVGTGKTMLCRLLARHLADQGFDVAFVPDPDLDRETLLRCIAADLGLAVRPGESALVALYGSLLDRHCGGRRLVILIDDAQALSGEALDAARMLMNVESQERKLVQVVLFGQPELDRLISRPELRQVRDRIAHRFDLEPLDDEQAAGYVEHRLRVAGWQGERLLEPGALPALLRAGAGRMRALSLMADRALLAAFADGSRSVRTVHVQRARQELAPGRWRFASPAWRAPFSVPDWLRQLTVPPPAMAAVMTAVAGAAIWVASPPPAANGPASAGPAAQLAAGGNLDASSLSPDRLLANSPPSAGHPASARKGGTQFTLQLASLSSRSAAEAELARLAPSLPDLTLHIVSRRSTVDPEGTVTWTVCAGRWDQQDTAQRAAELLPKALGAVRPLVRKVSA